MSGAADAARVAARLKAHATEVIPVTSTIMDGFGDLLVKRVQARASGRPGPERTEEWQRRGRPTDYHDSIHKIVEAGDPYVVGVGTNAPQGWRLERGFHGLDAIGRFYDQGPFPHWGPAWDETIPEFLVALRAGTLAEELAV